MWDMFVVVWQFKCLSITCNRRADALIQHSSVLGNEPLLWKQNENPELLKRNVSCSIQSTILSFVRLNDLLRLIFIYLFFCSAGAKIDHSHTEMSSGWQQVKGKSSPQTLCRLTNKEILSARSSYYTTFHFHLSNQALQSAVLRGPTPFFRIP